MPSGNGDRIEDAAVIGVVGGVGCGKSAVVGWASSRLPVDVVDADAIGHEVLRSPGILSQIREKFGSAVFDEQGEVVRRRLADRVFGTSQNHLVARRELERIVHPEIRRHIVQRIAEGVQSGRSGVVLLDAAVLLEAGWRDLCRWVVYVDCPEEVRASRVNASRGWSEEELSRRESSQLPLRDKRRLSDIVIDNSGELAAAGEQLAGIVRRCLSFKPTGRSSHPPPSESR